jgi:endonuclease YncB( thermonuclease family)
MRRLVILVSLCAGAAQAAAAELQGRVVAVHDGDTMTVEVDGKRLWVGLDGVDAPELAQPYGRSARRSLAALCRGKDAAIVERGKDELGRILGTVSCDKVDVGTEQVRRGLAWVHRTYLPLGSPLYEFEATARLRGVGLWRGKEPVPPWEWRAGSAKKGGAAKGSKS